MMMNSQMVRGGLQHLDLGLFDNLPMLTHMYVSSNALSTDPSGTLLFETRVLKHHVLVLLQRHGWSSNRVAARWNIRLPGSCSIHIVRRTPSLRPWFACTDKIEGSLAKHHHAVFTLLTRVVYWLQFAGCKPTLVIRFVPPTSPLIGAP